ncbi:hypothetical protein K501DRAFT_337721 [Backusella circina FSU 941]|nr:hypothetical protein K501DRAFT_337721 [Backusella circina FSU 941]
MRHKKKTQKQKFVPGETPVNKLPAWRGTVYKRAREDAGESSGRRKRPDQDYNLRIYSNLEVEFEQRLLKKIRHCKGNKDDLQKLINQEKATDHLERGVVSEADKLAGYDAGTIDKCMKRLKNVDKLTPIKRYHAFVESNFERLIVVDSTLEETPDKPSKDIEVDSTPDAGDIRAFTMSFNQSLREDLPDDIKEHMKNKLNDTIEQASDYSIQFSLLIRKLMLRFANATYTMDEDGEVSFESATGFDITDILPAGFQIEGEAISVAPPLNRDLLKVHLAPSREKSYKEHIKKKIVEREKKNKKPVSAYESLSIPYDKISLVNKSRNSKRRLIKNEQKRLESYSENAAKIEEQAMNLMSERMDYQINFNQLEEDHEHAISVYYHELFQGIPMEDDIREQWQTQVYPSTDMEADEETFQSQSNEYQRNITTGLKLEHDIQISYNKMYEKNSLVVTMGGEGLGPVIRILVVALKQAGFVGYPEEVIVETEEMVQKRRRYSV